ncbi:MAG: hypothetical protein JNK04_08895 [Myxococcales bacterium]|nr:hypothetical protein [Myxococcales bacterium]
MASAKLRRLSSSILGGCLAVVAIAASCTVGDAICTDKTVDEDRNDDCPYGPPGGPQKEETGDGCQVTFDDTSCTKTFRDDVFPILARPNDIDSSGGGCMVAACHGPSGTGSIAIVLPEDSTPDELYALLAAYENDAGQKYLGENDSNSYFICNVKATIGGGSAMPPSSGLTDSPKTTVDDGDLAVVEEWVRCGMKLDGVGGVGGGGTGGGGTGGAGTGGAGGGI